MHVSNNCIENVKTLLPIRKQNNTKVTKLSGYEYELHIVAKPLSKGKSVYNMFFSDLVIPYNLIPKSILSQSKLVMSMSR